MQLDKNNNLIINIKDKTQLYSGEEIKRALEDYEKNKIATNQVSFCANHDRDTQEAIGEYYKASEQVIWDARPGIKINNPPFIDKKLYLLGMDPYENTEKDPIVEAVREDLLQRSQVGISKYKVTLARTDLSLKDWHQHLYEEILDSANYLKRIILQLDKKENNTLLETHEMD